MSTKSLLAALLIVANLLSACATLPSPAAVATQDGKQSYVVAGQGSPTVILAAGLGDGKESWVSIYNKIAEQTKVFAYDRAGYGSSRSSNNTRDGATIVRELHSTLQTLHLQPLYILVGHSIGGTYMELYARTYPEEVAGVVFVDSRHADFTRQCLVADAGSCTPPAFLSALMPQGPKREMAAGEQTFNQVLSAGPFPNVPLVVLSRSKQLLESARFYEVWLETQESLASLSNDSKYILCERCGHYVHKDNPKLVVDAVTSVIEKARKRHSPAGRSQSESSEAEHKQQ